MEEVKQEANSFDEKADALLEEMEKETPGASSGAEQTKGDGTQPPESAGAGPEKTDQIKDVEADRTLSVEEKLSKIKEIIGDDEKALDAYIKQKGYHNDPAWQKQREMIDRLKQEGAKSALSPEDKALLEDVKKVTSSREYIETAMKAQGYTQDAIDKALRDRGFDVATKPDDLNALVFSKLGVKPETLDDNTKAIVDDVIKIANIIIEDRLGKVLPNQLKPIQEHLSQVNREIMGDKLIKEMKETVSKEGILDFDKDVTPELNKYLDEHPEITQEELRSAFIKINHALSIERLRTGKKREEEQGKKDGLRQTQNTRGAKVNIPARTGNFDKDADSLLDSLGMTY